MSIDSVRFSPFVDGYCDVENQLPGYLMREAERFFSKEKSEKDSIVCRDDFEERRRRIQEYFVKSAGGLPNEKTPLNAKVTGIVEKERYRIEKVIFESLPRFYVTALLYVPKNLEGRTPGILFVCGHARPAKAYSRYQKVCIDLAENGFTVLAIDPLGQGERLQYWDPKTKSEVVPWGTTEHSYFGFQCILTGDNIARYFIWDAMRGIDYLASREEVDDEKIGVTGSSGGGTQTAYLMMADPRIKAAAPCTYITSIDALVKTIGPQDSEQNIFGAIREGLNHDDYIQAFAPKPVLIGAAAYDFFAIEGTLQTFERARRIYRLYNAEENVALHIGRHTHMYSDELREAVVNWFRVHLKSEPPDFKTGEAATEPEDSLNVTCTGQILGEIPGARTGFDLNVEHWTQKKPRRRLIETEDDLREYVSRVSVELRRLLKIGETRAPIYPRTISTGKWEDLKAEKIFFFSEPGITLTSVMICDENADRTGPPVLALFEDGTNMIPEEHGLIRGLTDEGNKVLVLDVRGLGGVKARKTDTHGTEFNLAYDAYLLGTSLTGTRVSDVLRGIEYLRLRSDVDFERLGLYAKGQAAVYGLFAAALSPEVKSLACEDMLYSYEDVIRTRLYKGREEEALPKPRGGSTGLEGLLINGILESFDIVDLLPLLHGRSRRFINLRNAEQKTASLDELNKRWFEVVGKHYPILGNVRRNVVLKGET